MTTNIFGVDFTSSPRPAKAITIAHARLDDDTLLVERVARLSGFDEFEQFLRTPGSWVGGFDFPFGMPRALVETLAWPTDWPSLIHHVRTLGRDGLKLVLDQARARRPVGAKYIYRRGDAAAGSSSPMKLVNPPVALMFFEGASRLLDSGVSVMPCAPRQDPRIALEAYPGYWARALSRDSYKSDGKDGAAAKRVAARGAIVAALPRFTLERYGLRLLMAATLAQRCVSDGSGDTLDAVLCAAQAAVAQMAFDRGDPRYGLAVDADDFEGWIAAVEPIRSGAHESDTLPTITR